MEERNSQFSTNFLFNAKELDNETGLYYYGARYLDPTGAMWLSVDPLFEKYAGMSPYNYCAGNPVKLVDLDGRDIKKYTREVDDGVWITKAGFLKENRWEAFAKTKAGYLILSQFAKAGDKIGSITFKTNGEYSNHELRLYDYNIVYGDRVFNSPFEIKSNRLIFKIGLNQNSISIKSDESAEVTLGHEFFIHFDKYYKTAISAFERGDKKLLLNMIEDENWKNAGDEDHKGIKYKRGVFKFNQYVDQLKVQSKDPLKVIKAKNEHDE